MSKESVYTLSQRALVELWADHATHEFGDRITEKALDQDLLAQRRGGES